MQSPRRKQNVHQIQALQNTSQIIQPIISSHRKAELTQKLELEKTALKRVAQRQKKNQLILSYDVNPFRELHPHNKAMKGRLIIDQISQLTNQGIRSDFFEQRDNLIKGMDRLMTMSDKVNYDVAKQIKYGFGKGEVKKKVEKQGQILLLNEHTMKLSEIRKIEEPNINGVKPKNFNLYQEASRFSQYQTLDNHYLQQFFFVHNSLAETMNFLSKQATYRQISKMARQIMTNKPIKQNVLDYLDSYQLSFNVRDLNFRDMMNVSSGRFKQDFLFTYLNEIEMDKDDKISLSISQEDEDVVYKTDQVNLGVETEDLDISQFEIECLIKAPLEHQELIVKNNYLKLLKTIETQIEMKRKAIEKGINDKRVHEIRKQKIIENLKIFKVPNQMTERELKKLVGKNKLRKNKEEEIKLQAFKKAVSQTIEGKRGEQDLKSSIIFH